MKKTIFNERNIYSKTNSAEKGHLANRSQIKAYITKEILTSVSKSIKTTSEIVLSDVGKVVRNG